MQQPTHLPDAQSPQDTKSQYKKDKMTIEDTRTAKEGNTWKSKLRPSYKTIIIRKDSNDNDNSTTNQTLRKCFDTLLRDQTPSFQY